MTRLTTILCSLLLAGCATTPTTIPWSPLPDYTAPEPPPKAPDDAEACANVSALRPGDTASCTGLLLPPSEVQYLYDVDDQGDALRRLLTLSVEGRERDRAWADAHYERLLWERDQARRQRWEAFGVGLAIGFGICGGGIGIAIGASAAQ